MSRGKQKRGNSTAIRRYGLIRPLRVKQPLPIVVVVCDDTKTAVAYFQLLKRLVSQKVTVKVVPKPNDRASADDVLETAVAESDALKTSEATDNCDRNSVWALIDLEWDKPRRDAAFRVKQTGAKCGINVALSNPCYEVWTLLHLIDTGETFANCSAVIVRLTKEWKRIFKQDFGKKAQADYGKLMDQRSVASRRAKIRRGRNDPSWTEVYGPVDQIDSY